MAHALVRAARPEDDLPLCRTLMREYAAYLNRSVGDEHICIDSLEAELEGLPGPYAEPDGLILLAFVEDRPAGCVALKPLQPILTGERACEMKRLWVRPAFQGQGLGRLLATEAIRRARSAEYTAMYLDTMPSTMQAASALYIALGFVPVERYTRNPVLRETAGGPGVAYLRLDLLAS
ncbi:GNAT family N-acetyltransferase [Paracidobacterium acidisoli]|uniref:GNAT family N-acetyltransferase n=1 Tax=Paracidobacterium acidisoli TaxID=2303751 RepID=A0A372IJ28_9BACT|nr:GNAT family N-acetyltransferase [Paracidobacterium acidisoli]MBT9333309.1 GNAT family N-acetyltransferase [Paracidobacterium acidisoli]